MAAERAEPARILPLGDGALTIQLGDKADEDIQQRVLGFCAEIQDMQDQGALAGVIEWAPAFASVTIYFDPDRLRASRLATLLRAVAQKRRVAGLSGRKFEIPCCFDADFAPDLAPSAQDLGLRVDDMLRLFLEQRYRVAMLGFLPGFAYLVGLPRRLATARLKTPRKTTPARSLAIADDMCALYPWESPGGWRLIGRSPVELFDADNVARPALLAPGDSVRFAAVDRAAYDALDALWRAGGFDPARLIKAQTP